MKNRKKIIAVMLAAVLSMCSGCGQDDKSEDKETATGYKKWDTEATVSSGSDGADTDSDNDVNNSNNDGSSINDNDSSENISFVEDNLNVVGHYSDLMASDNNKLVIKTDADIRTTDCKNYPVVRISTETIDDAFLKKAKDVLVGDTPMYDGVRMYDPIYDEYSGDQMVVDEADKKQIEGKVLRKDITKYPIETKMSGVSELADKYSDIPDYEWYYLGLMPEGKLYYGVSDGKDGNYMSLSVTDSRTYGDSLKFFKSKEYGIRDGLVMPGINTGFCWPVEKGISWISDDSNPNKELFPPNIIRDANSGDSEEYFDCIDDPNFKGYTFRESDKETNNISKEEAVKQADELLKKLEISDIYAASAVEEKYISDHAAKRRTTNSDGTYTEELTVGRVWHIIYQPVVNGNIVEDYGEMVKYDAAGRKEAVWFSSNVEVMVNDNGIVGFSYACPIKYDELMDDSAELKDIEEIKKIYKAEMMNTLNKSDYFYGILDDATKFFYGFVIEIDDISLRYARISDHESNESGYLIPVWDFSGKAYNEAGELVASGSFLQIDAIDGSIYSAFEGK